jgi:hypothetical protein
MGDLIAVANSIQSKIAQAKEHYQAYSQVLTYEQQVKIKKYALVLGFVIMVMAFYLSWTRNTRLGETTGMKLLYGVLAAMFGTTYLFFYLIRFTMEKDMLKIIK